MAGTETSSAVRDDPDNSRFVVDRDGAVAELLYDLDDGRLYLLHTETPEAVRGQGIGGQLVRAAMARARAGGLIVVPWCPFARRWLREHPEVAATADIDWRTMPPPEDPDAERVDG